jgi:integrase
MTRTRDGKKLGQHLTAKNVLTLPGPSDDSPNVDHMDQALPGFGLRVSRGGQRAWIVRYTVSTTGRRRRMTLGECRADDAGLTLADARDKARKALRQAAEGIDPAEQQRERREGKTFGDLAASYLQFHAKDKRSLPEDTRIINNELLPTWKHIKLADLARADVLTIVREKAKTAPIMANRIAALVSTMLNCALDDELVESNVAARIPKEEETSRDRVLTDAELAELWMALSETARNDDQGRPLARLNATLNDLFKTRIWTLQRGKEVARITWADVDLVEGMWEIPADIAKNKQAHRVPLTTPVVELLARRLQTARETATWVFEGEVAGSNVGARMKKAASFLVHGDVHRSRRRRGATGTSVRKQRPAYLPGLSFDFQSHDLRRTGSTALGEAGVADPTISRILNHIVEGPRSTRTYNRARHDAVKRAALELWARKLDAIVTGQKTTNVLAFAGTR